MLKPNDQASGKIKQIIAIQWGKIYAAHAQEPSAADSRKKRLILVSGLIGRAVRSLNDLTMVEAVQVKKELGSIGLR
jgi:hypothetical protein